MTHSLPQASQEVIRAEFEAWAKLNNDDRRGAYNGTAWYYFDDEADTMWQAWQAARASQPLPQPPQGVMAEDGSSIKPWNERTASFNSRKIMQAKDEEIAELRAALSRQSAPNVGMGEPNKRIYDALNTTLWLYRRLPSCYGQPPFVDAAIMAFADELGLDAPAAIQERHRLHIAPHQEEQKGS